MGQERIPQVGRVTAASRLMRARSRLPSVFRHRYLEAQAEIESSKPTTIVQRGVERTLAWSGKFRRLAGRYEH